ncbi:MAG: CsgG/HfaB family protein [bacterium]|nr:CsgG/HfaB family protein [bacterium]
MRKFLFILTAGLLLFGGGVKASEQIEQIAKEAISHLASTITDPSLKGVAIWNIKDPTESVNTVKLKDELTYCLVNTKRFKVVQRDILASALKEIDLETASDISDYFDQETTKEFSRVQPIDGLIFGEVYPTGVTGEGDPCLILRMLDIEKQRLVWAKELPLSPSKDHLLDEMVDKTIEDIKAHDSFIKEAGVDKIAILNISNDTYHRKVNERFLIDKLTANLVMRSDLEVVDRNNLKKLFEEYRLGKETFTDSLGREHSIINPETIKKLGNVYGIKGFILGEITSAIVSDNSLSILLKMVSSDKGEIVWGKSLNINLPLSETEGVVVEAVKDLSENLDRLKIKSMGVWEIANKSSLSIQPKHIVDQFDIHLARGRQVKIVNRDNLETILKEQKEGLTGLIDPETRAKLSKVHGMDSVLYGTFYNNPSDGNPNPVLIVKVVDLEKGILIWSAEIPVNKRSIKTETDVVAEELTSFLTRERKASPDKKVSFWRILDKSSLKVDENLIIDKLTVNLMKADLFKMIDRSQLEKLMAEVRHSKEGIIDRETAKKLGQMYGIDLFLYGSFYDNTFGFEKNPSFILKMADLEKGNLVWAKEMPLGKDYIKTGIDEGMEKVIAFLKEQGDKLKPIKTAAFLQFTDKTEKIGEDILIDKLTSKMVDNFSFSLIDRSSLTLLIEEIKKAKEGILDEKSVELGKRYGVDAFITGEVKKESEIKGSKVVNTYTISAKVIEIATGKVLAMVREKAEEEIKEGRFVEERKKEEKARELTEKGISHYQNKDYKKAISFFEEAIKLGFVSQKTWLHLGLSFFRLKDEKNGYRVIKKAVDMNPDSSLGRLVTEALRPILVAPYLQVKVDLGSYNSSYSKKAGELIKGHLVDEIRAVLDDSWRFKRVNEDMADLRLSFLCEVSITATSKSDNRLTKISLEGKNSLEAHNLQKISRLSFSFTNSFGVLGGMVLGVGSPGLRFYQDGSMYMKTEDIKNLYLEDIIKELSEETLPELADKIDKKLKEVSQ